MFILIEGRLKYHNIMAVSEMFLNISEHRRKPQPLQCSAQIHADDRSE